MSAAAALSSRLITQTFRLHGLSITPDAMQHLLEQAPAYKLPPAQFLSQLLSKIDKTSRTAPFTPLLYQSLPIVSIYPLVWSGASISLTLLCILQSFLQSFVLSVST
jgi:hypothetical protein